MVQKSKNKVASLDVKVMIAVTIVFLYHGGL